MQPNLKPKVLFFIFYILVYSTDLIDLYALFWILDETLSGVCGFLFSNTQISEENQSRTPRVLASKLKVVVVVVVLVEEGFCTFAACFVY